MEISADVLEELFAYNRAANQKIIHVFYDLNFSDEKAFSLFSHVLNAHHLWLARIRQQEAQFGVWQVHLVANFNEIDETNHTETASLLVATPDLSEMIIYQNSSGKSYQNRISDMLLHVINHSTYHRGQIASLIRQHGLEPPATDYIFYQREKQ